MTLEELSNEELLEVFKYAVEGLHGGGAFGRSHYYEVKEEMLNRMSPKGDEGNDE